MPNITIPSEPSVITNPDGSLTTYVRFDIPKDLVSFNPIELLAGKKVGWSAKIPDPSIYNGPAPDLASVPPENMIDNPESAIAADNRWLWGVVATEFNTIITEMLHAQADQQAATVTKSLVPFLPK